MYNTFDYSILATVKIFANPYRLNKFW